MIRALVCVVLLGCSPDPCSPDEQGRIEAAYVAELLRECGDYRSLGDCPAYPSIEAKYDLMREEWVRCK
jgi:hypothetical protein